MELKCRILHGFVLATLIDIVLFYLMHAKAENILVSRTWCDNYNR